MGFGFRLIKIQKGSTVKLDQDLTVYPYDISEDELFVDLFEVSRMYSMVSIERMYALYKAVEYIVKNKIAGEMVECGVWRGGSCMLMANMLSKMTCQDRKIYLYDTFTGMTKPNVRDVRHDGLPASEIWQGHQKLQHNNWAYSPIEEVRQNMRSTGYPDDKLFFVKGDIRDTIPKEMPQTIALLRLDTDWFDSTYHELRYLYPLLSPGGVLIIDDYGCWKGARQAVDQYFRENSITIMLHRSDDTGRIGIK